MSVHYPDRLLKAAKTMLECFDLGELQRLCIFLPEEEKEIIANLRAAVAATAK